MPSQACAAGYHSFNGNGEMTGVSWLEEAGSLNMPILITNTHAVGPCHRGTIDWVARNKPEVSSQWMLPSGQNTRNSVSHARDRSTQ